MEKQTMPYPSIDTPALLLDMNNLEVNIEEMTRVAREAGIRLRPHIKMHESAFIANLQLKAGACGIEVGPVDQAEAMVEAGFDDIVIAHPFYGSNKLEKLRKMLKKHNTRITCVVDMIEQTICISQVGKALGREIPVLIKIETGGKRYGVLPGAPALTLAKKFSGLPGIRFIGIYSHELAIEPTTESVEKRAFEVASMMSETARIMRQEGMNIEHVSVGSSPTFRTTCRLIKEGKFPEITEIHPGSCVIGDRIYVTWLAMNEERCALTVLATVVSTAQPDHAVIDCGGKTFGADAMLALRDKPNFFYQGKPRFGLIRGRPDLWLGRLSAETGCIYYTDTTKRLEIGDRVEIIPNNAILTINIHDRMYGVRNGVIERAIPISARGRGN